MTRVARARPRWIAAASGSESARSEYALPPPPKTLLLGGAGWAFGVGCGAGPFLGLGVAANARVLFGAGLGVGAFCGVGFGAGAVMAIGSGHLQRGNVKSFFYTPRLSWLERYVAAFEAERERRRVVRLGAAVWRQMGAIGGRVGAVWRRVRPRALDGSSNGRPATDG